MSLLEELLRKAEKRPESSDIPPQLEGLLARKNKRKKTISLIIFFSLFPGVVLVVLLFIVNQPGLSLFPEKTEPERTLLEVKNQRLEIKKQGPDSPESLAGSIATDSPQQYVINQGSQNSHNALSELNPHVMSKPVDTEKGKGESLAKEKSKFKSNEKKSELHSITSKGLIASAQEPEASDRRELLYRANSLEQRGEYEKAIEYYEQILKTDPSDHRILNQIAYLYIKLRLPDSAIHYAQRIRELRPGYVPGMINHSVALIMKGEYKEAEKVLVEIISIEPYNKTALYNLALILEKEERLGEAEEFYKRLSSAGDIRGNEGLKRLELKKSLVDKGKDEKDKD
ncbi:MAG: tetratricopeptide repeat protein [Thermodesulfovibrionales bacterium]|nr:tetratricopeptide repeat protein [Thermodesulfovibrionales bacterium]